MTQPAIVPKIHTRPITAWLSAALAGALLAGGPKDAQAAPSRAPAGAAPVRSPSAAKARRTRAKPRRVRLPGLALDQKRTIGAPIHLGKLTVFPIYAHLHLNVGKFVTLQEAVRRGKATVREIGTSNARVGTLIIDNRGDEDIVVLGGTVVKGGKQDRQIGEDLVVESRKQVKVRAFCVEQGRWNPSRGGRLTGGNFKVLESLANTQVRIAGQHKRNQRTVWQNVAQLNKMSRKTSGTGTLLATLDARDIQRKRKQLTSRAAAQLDRVPKARLVTGLAYAINGKVRNVRWFAGNALYKRFRKILLNTAALEAVVAPKRPHRRIQAGAVKLAIASFKRATRVRAETKAYNFAEYSRSRRGYKSTLRFRPKRRGRRAPMAAPLSSGFDF